MKYKKFASISIGTLLVLSIIFVRLSSDFQSVNALCGGIIEGKELEGTWISNDRTKNTVYQDIDSDGKVHITWYGKTHDELARTYNYIFEGIWTDTKIEGTVTYLNPPPGSAPTLGPGYADMVINVPDPKTPIIQKSPPIAEADFESYKWKKACAVPNGGSWP
ncbi:hypothetical protein [Candidatus Nitrosocosmicus sp. T]